MAVGETSRQDMLSLDREQRFANSVAREFSLLLGRAWRQASRNRIVQVGACGRRPVKRPLQGSLKGPRGPDSKVLDVRWPPLRLLPPPPLEHLAPPCLAGQQIVTVVQTTVIGLVLAWLYSGMSKTAAGIQVTR